MGFDLGGEPRSKPMRAVQKVSLKDRLDHQQHSHLHHPVLYARNPQGPQLAIGLRNVHTPHRQRTIGFGLELFLDFIEKPAHSTFPFLYAADGYLIHTRRPLVRLHPRPRRLKHITAVNPVIQGIKPELTLLLSLAAQFPSQKRDLLRHPRFHLEPFRHPFRNRALTAQAVSPPFDQNMTEVWLLRSIPFQELLRYYEPLRLPAAATSQVIDSLKSLSMSFNIHPTPGLPGSSTDLSARALLNHPGRPSRCSHSFLPCWWQASPYLEGWPPPSKRNEAESGSLALGLTPSLSREVLSLSPLSPRPKDRPTSRFWLPSAGGRNFMSNEQLTRMALYSHIDQPGLSWRTRLRRFFVGILNHYNL